MLGPGIVQCNDFPCDIGSVRIFPPLISNLLIHLRPTILDDRWPAMAFVISPEKSSRQTPNFQDSISRSSRQNGAQRKVSTRPQSPRSPSGRAGCAVGCATGKNTKSLSSPMPMCCAISPTGGILRSLGRTPRSESIRSGQMRMKMRLWSHFWRPALLLREKTNQRVHRR
jgi:hypothetical protein